MTIREFFELYKEPSNMEERVWEFIVDKNDKFVDKQDLYEFYQELLDKEIIDFTIINQIDYEQDIVYSLGGLKVYPKAKVFIYTTDWCE